MMGERRVMQALFYGFSPERHVPDSTRDRPVRRSFGTESAPRTLLFPSDAQFVI
jgi:hypothetical protein